ncbi:NUDIX domain-containing protein [Bdellovibrio bacteriovorus]|uniref:NUDIX domain-containing protein n=1 Tax=Bdellovibrio bacteriovorus TaxID=959 RepID=UPI003AA85898
MEKKLLPEKEYLESLPKKRMGVGVLLFSEDKILILKPTYKDHWLLPGGVIDLNESPREAAIREVHEELGLQVEIKQLLVVDYLHKAGERTECIQFLFSGGNLSKEQIDSIRLQDEEISDMQFVALTEAKKLVSEHTRIRLSFIESNPQKSIYLENGKI